MDRSNHYEAAFEAYLQERGFSYIAIDETRRALYGDKSLKNLDFIVHATTASHLLIDVKGRRFPAGPPTKPRAVWECWSTSDDLEALDYWRRLFGPGYQGLLLFLYDIDPAVRLPDEVEDLWCFRGRRYLLRAVAADDYQMHRRVRSPRWGTVSLPAPVYRRLAQPFSHFVQQAQPAMEEDYYDIADATPF
ncbi:MAG TPA: HYExAFE family protein [Gemmataceae bacterium]|nr:HYExAFE family protein [Gemmataceae bacterium]